MSIRKFMKIVNETQQLDEILGWATDQIFGVRTTPKQSKQYPNSAEVLQNDFEDNKTDWGQRYNFERYMPDIEKDQDFVRLVDAFEEDENGNSRYSQREEFDMCKPMARRLNHTTGQIWAYIQRGPYYRSHGNYDTSKWSPTDGPNSPYYKPGDFDLPGRDKPYDPRGNNA